MEAVDPAHLRDFHQLDAPVCRRNKADAVLLVTEDEGAPCGQFRFEQAFFRGRIQHEEGIALACERFVALAETLMKMGGKPFERTLGWFHLEIFGTDEVDGAGAEGIAAAEDLADVEGWFQVVEHDDEIVNTRPGIHHVVTPVLDILPLGPQARFPSFPVLGTLGHVFRSGCPSPRRREKDDNAVMLSVLGEAH